MSIQLDQSCMGEASFFKAEGLTTGTRTEFQNGKLAHAFQYDGFIC